MKKTQPPKSIVAQNLLTLRNFKNWSQEKFAKQFGVKRVTLAAQELGNGEPKSRQASAIADYFGITTDDLFNKALKEADLTLKTMPIELELAMAKKEIGLLTEQLELYRGVVKDKDRLIEVLSKRG